MGKEESIGYDFWEVEHVTLKGHISNSIHAKKTGFVLQMGVGRDLGDMERCGVIATIKIHFKN